MNEQSINCLHCNSVNTILHMTSRSGLRWYRCLDCDMIFNRDFATREYDKTYFMGKYHLHRRRRIATGWRRLLLIRSIVPKGRLLDIGCSLGYFIEAAQNFGYIAEGLDIGKFAVDFCLNRGFRACYGDAVNLPYPDKYFSVVTLINSLEHIENLDKCLSEVSRVIVRDGCVMIVGPNAGYWKALHRPSYDYWEKSYHLVTFTSRFLSNILQQHGLRVVSPSRIFTLFRHLLSILNIDKNVVIFARRIDGR